MMQLVKEYMDKLMISNISQEPISEETGRERKEEVRDIVISIQVITEIIEERIYEIIVEMREKDKQLLRMRPQHIQEKGVPLTSEDIKRMIGEDAQEIQRIVMYLKRRGYEKYVMQAFSKVCARDIQMEEIKQIVDHKSKIVEDDEQEK